MKKLLLLTLPLFLAACNRTDNTGGAQTPVGTIAPMSVSVWNKVTEKNTCEAMNPDFCVGYWGFAVESSGSFSAGPDANGGVVSGQISQEELNQMDSLATTLVLNKSRGTECDAAVANVPGSSDRVTLEFPGSDPLVVFAKPSPNSTRGACFLGGRDNAVKLHDYLNLLMNKYYPRPFTSRSQKNIPLGHWGGDDISIEVTATGGTFHLGCSQGTLDHPLVLDSNNQFSGTGKITQSGGPLDPAHPHTPHDATFQGTVSGAIMMMRVHFSNDRGVDQNDNYTATYGQASRFNPCPH